MNLHAADSARTSGMLILLAALVLSLGGIMLLLYSARMTREAVTKRIGLIRPVAAALSRTVPLAAALIRSGLQGAEERERREIARLLQKFNVPAHHAALATACVHAVSVVTLASLGFIAASRWLSASSPAMLPLLLATACGIVGWFVPIMVIRKMVKARTKAIVAGLPDALELLVICVEAGLSFEDGIDRVANILLKSQPPLGEELARTSADLKILPSREQALANFAGRVDTPSVRTVVTTLSQTLRYGTPLAQGLRVVSGELRNDTLVRLEERANQLPTLMTIPMMLFIMPTIFMIVAGPAALHVIDAMKH
jgi:tight adherence protein C